MTTKFCSTCEESSEGEGFLDWKGREYCRHCLSEVEPELKEYLAEHTSLQSVLAISDVRHPSTVKVVFISAMVIMLGLLGMLLGLYVEVILALIVLVALFVVTYSLIVLCYNRTHHYRLPRTLSIDFGIINCEWPKGHISVATRDCFWFIGDTPQDFWSPTKEDARAIIVQLPDGRRAATRCDEDEKLAIWSAFLSISDAIHLEDMDRRTELRLWTHLIGRTTAVTILFATICASIVAWWIGNNAVVPWNMAGGFLIGVALGGIRANSKRRLVPIDSIILFVMFNASAFVGFAATAFAGCNTMVVIISMGLYIFFSVTAVTFLRVNSQK